MRLRLVEQAIRGDQEAFASLAAESVDCCYRLAYRILRDPERFDAWLGPATKAKLNRPLDVAFGSGGRMFIADENNARIRQVDARGIITTIGGTGRLGCDGDGGAATAAPIQNANSIAVGPDGAIAIASGECSMVRTIGSDGILRTVAGTGVDGCVGLDGGLATVAELSGPTAVGYAANGDLYLTDGCGLERIDAAGRIHRLADPATAGG